MDEIKAFLDTLNLPLEDLELYVRILFQALLLLSSAVFSGSETALFSLSRIDLQKLRQSRHSDSESIHAMLDEPRRLIISILCGNELVNIASAVNMTAILLLVFGAQDVGWINVLIMVPLLLLIGEVTPKTIAVSYPIKFSTMISARVLPRWILFISPLRAAVRLVADAANRRQRSLPDTSDVEEATGQSRECRDDAPRGPRCARNPRPTDTSGAVECPESGRADQAVVPGLFLVLPVSRL